MGINNIKFKRFGILIFLSIALVLVLLNFDKVQNLLPKADVPPANLVLHPNQPGKPLLKPWQNLAQGGESKDWNLKSISAEVRSLQPKYIRIDHLYDFYIDVTVSGNSVSLNFTKLDQLLNDFKAVGSLPFISLSYMPSSLNSDITGLPSNIGLYFQTIQKTIEHISGKSGLNLNNVYYEVWNEPDLFGNYKTYGSKNYFTLYQTAANAAAKAANVNSFKFGGPATTKLYDNWTKNLLQLVVDQNLRLDFYSWHHYTFDDNEYIEDMNRFKSVKAQFPSLANVETIISEWGPTPENHPSYDGTTSAAHLISSSFVFKNIGLSKAFAFEIQDGKDPAGNEKWGRWGMLTHSDFGSHLKPRGTALKLLNSLDSTEIPVTGQNDKITATATKNNDKIKVLIVNYDNAGKYSQVVPLSINPIPEGEYTITKTYLHKAPEKITTNLITSTYQTEIAMTPQTACLVEIIPAK